MGREHSFGWGKCDGGWEVLLYVNHMDPRRVAFCTHEDDARNIIVALRCAKERGDI